MTDIYRGLEVHGSSDVGPYTALSVATESAMRALRTTAPAPDPVVAAVIKALSVSKPRLRYPVGTEARVISACRGILPERAFGFVVRRATSAYTWRQRG